jgi:hypothetical protein
MIGFTDDQIYDPTYVDNESHAKAWFRKLYNKRKRIVTKIESNGKPGLIYYNHNDSIRSNGTNWIDSKSLYDPTSMFALLDAGVMGWGLKMYPEKFLTGFEDYYFRYGSLSDSDEDDNQIYLVRFHNQQAYSDFKLTSWFKPVHLVAPEPASTHVEDVFSDSNIAQLKGWRKQFEGSGFSDNEIEGIVNYHKDFARMNLLFLGDITSMNLAYRYIGGEWEKQWVLHNLKDEEDEE